MEVVYTVYTVEVVYTAKLYQRTDQIAARHSSEKLGYR